uniref:Glycoside hydrolase family 16 n=1 Tax=uncultured bacterium contig00033 TaxID=1181522 RepID=A0A806KIZ6_9BACT|nr:glycoside hydrolase family 16 [uncultured bacterium contig00033]
MVSVSGGNLRIKIKRDEALGKNWVRTGAVQTRKALPNYWGEILYENTYGYYEARVKFPVVQGTWGAFWLMTRTMEQIPNSGAIGTEIDIVETIHNQQGKYSFALHWDGYGSNHKSTGKEPQPVPVNIYDGSYHTFALDWSPSEYVFYVDSHEVWRVDGGANFNNSGINRNPNYIIFSVEGADWAWDLSPDFDEAEVLIDYVRVWNQPQR